MMEEVGVKYMRQLQREMRSRAWFTSVPHRLHGTEMSQEEFRNNLHLRNGLMFLKIPTDCDGCGKKFTTNHAMLCPKEEILLDRHDDTAK